MADQSKIIRPTTEQVQAEFVTNLFMESRGSLFAAVGILEAKLAGFGVTSGSDVGLNETPSAGQPPLVSQKDNARNMIG